MPTTAAAAVATHRELDPRLSGVPVELAPGRATVELTTTPEMRADARGLVHGGFVFSLADHAAMLAVNDPHVVLGRAETRFLAPARVGERLVAEARVTAEDGRRRVVAVEVTRAGDGVRVLDGELVCHVLAEHVLDHAPRGRVAETAR